MSSPFTREIVLAEIRTINRGSDGRGANDPRDVAEEKLIAFLRDKWGPMITIAKANLNNGAKIRTGQRQRNQGDEYARERRQVEIGLSYPYMPSLALRRG